MATQYVTAGHIVSGSGFIQALETLKTQMTNAVSPALPANFSGDSASTGTQGSSSSTLDGSTVITHPSGDNKTRPSLPTISQPLTSSIINISDVYQSILMVLNTWLYYHHVTSEWWHNTDGTYSKVTSRSGYAYLNNTGQRTAQSIDGVTVSNNSFSGQNALQQPSSPAKGDIIAANTNSSGSIIGINDSIEALFNSWKNSMSTVSYTIYTCHYVCHSNYDNRVRR